MADTPVEAPKQNLTIGRVTPAVGVGKPQTVVPKGVAAPPPSANQSARDARVAVHAQAKQAIASTKRNRPAPPAGFVFAPSVNDIPQGSIITPFRTFMLFGDTGHGKTTLLAEYVKHLFKTLRKKTRLAMSDRGSLVGDMELMWKLGVVEVVPLFGDPWVWLSHVVKGDVWHKEYGWIPGIRDEIGLYAFEGMHSSADALMSWMGEAAKDGKNIGGDGATNFNNQLPGVTPEELMVIGTNNRSHYQVAQRQVVDRMWESQRLPGEVCWTSGIRRDEDQGKQQIVGPATAGGAIVADIPRWLKYTFRCHKKVMPNAPAEVSLYLDYMNDGLGGAVSAANARLPLGGKETKVDLVIKPASLVKAFDQIDKRYAAAEAEYRKELGL